MVATSDDTESTEVENLQAENRHLKNTIVTLREELEKNQQVRGMQVQDLTLGANDEITQLKATVNSLRDSLELVRAEEEERASIPLNDARAEISQFKRTTIELRAKLQQELLAHNEAMRQVERANQNAVNNLQLTIDQLRKQLDQDDS